GTETVVDATTGAVQASIPLGGDVGNVVYDPAIDKMIVAVQAHHQVVRTQVSLRIWCGLLPPA
ncbi:hypothetical protein, partial [Staphylococcus aureus]|uniref:hypothetical protein n=1 Tax=Staphylococcus aureus TaxID=1280 RepID=UPI0019156279